MTSEPDHELLARAAGEMREAPEPGWSETADRVVRAARAATRRTVPLRAVFPPDASLDGLPARAADRLTVSDQVVLSMLRRAVAAVPGCRPTRIRLDVQDGVCTGANLAVVATYGIDLAATGTAVRGLVSQVLADLLGPSTPDHQVDVAFIDVQEIDVPEIDVPAIDVPE